MLAPAQSKLLLVIAALFWSSGGFLIKWVTAGPLMVAGMRSLIAAIFLFLIFRPKFFPIRPFPFLVALSYAATVLCFVVATKWTSAANAILLQSTAPIYVALLGGFFLKERIRAIDVLTIACVFVGMLFFFKGEISSTGLRGNVLGLVSGFAFACFILLTRKSKEESPISMIILGNLIAAAIALPFAWQGEMLSSRDLTGLVLLGVFQLALPYALYARAIAQVPAIDAVLIVLLEPILNPIWVYLFLNERPDFWSLVGGSIVLGAVAFRSIFLAKRQS